MFLVRQGIDERHGRIAKFFYTEDATIAVLLAAADFERCIRRAILALGVSPTAQIRKQTLGRNFHGLDAFKKGWNDEVTPRLHKKLADDVVRNWSQFRSSFELRHRLIHGAQVRLTPAFATEAAKRILAASVDLTNFASAEGAQLDGIIRRYKRRDS